MAKEFFNFLKANSFDWVTKGKRNTVLFRKEIEPWSRWERYVPLNTRMLIKEAFPMLLAQGVSGLASVSIPNIYIKMPYEITNKKGRVVTKQRYTPIAAVVATRLEEDKDEQEEIILKVEETNEQVVRYWGIPNHS